MAKSPTRRRTPRQPLLPAALWLCRLQAVALVAGAVLIVVLSATSHTALSVGFLIADVVGALLLGFLLAFGPRKDWMRTPVLMIELLAVLVSTELWASGRPWIAIAVGAPALFTAVLVLRGNRAA